MRKLYVVNVLTMGKWQNVALGVRIFTTKRQAQKFAKKVTEINGCEIEFYSLKRSSFFGGAYCVRED